MRKVSFLYDDAPDFVFDLSSHHRRHSHFYPTKMFVPHHLANFHNLEAGLWELDNGMWIWIRRITAEEFTRDYCS